GGVPGVDSNIPAYQAQSAGGGQGEYERREVSRTMELNQIKERIVVAPGAVERLSVAVVINRDLTPQQRDAVQAMVASAIGYDQSRNDQITVMGFPFDTSVADEMKAQLQAEAQARARGKRQLAWAVAAGAALAGMALLVAFRRRSARVADQAVRAPGGPPPEAPPGLEEAARETTAERALRELERLARQQPQQVAQLLRTWLAEE
ncbi:MAG: hypothetical protein K6T75_05325, partial [Acetobacteraceae bacterium]|nr:hypothetical protein [Acetobacteraceae bacterium]